MPPERRAEIEAMVAAASPGPWLQVGGWTVDGPEDDGLLSLMVSIDVGDPADGAFIAMARDAVPELLADNARLRAEVARLTPAPKSPLTGVSVKDTGHGWQVRHRLYGKSRRPRNFLSKEAADLWVDELRAKHAAPAGATKDGAK